MSPTTWSSRTRSSGPTSACPIATNYSQIADELGLAPLAVEDAVESHERPKVDRYPTHLFLNTYAMPSA